MDKIWRRRVAAVALCLGVGAAPVPALADEAADMLARIGEDAQARAKAIDNGRGIATFCANCHGADGVSTIPEVPNLAAQNPDYLLTQINAFTSGKRKNEFMEGLMRALAPADKAALVLFYASLSAPTPRTVAESEVAAAKEAFDKICARCHGGAAHGSTTTPRLAGQQTEYLRQSLRRYLTMSGERFYPPMTAAVTQLGEKNIDAVTVYLGSLK
ncbi:c-type cytochrome [Denitromonas iodatirespirans]|uniref:C-type cytochrome n=1 Tax=Denitromonas iodatirespirans TaxID=2795389 RepID=A0A944H9R0_DENI1|nr:c-type cytochrome [Denitromonas iodatirespirans]MBT0963698.1 c-type cytochrome [Denitromonas iodatirespirans]